MFVRLEEIIEKINEAERVSVIYAAKDPSARAGAEMLGKIPNVKTYGWDSHGFSVNALPSKEMLGDFNVFLGIHFLHPGGFKNVSYLRVTDIIDLNLGGSVPTYICNKKNLPACPLVKTTSHAHFGYYVAKEFGVEPTKEEALQLLLGDFDDNRELAPTEFQREMAEIIGLENEVPNFIRKLGKYQLFDFLPATIRLDFTQIFNFEYQVEGEEVKNRFPIDGLLIENPRTLEKKLLEWGLKDEIYSYEIDGKTVREKLQEMSTFNLVGLKADVEAKLQVYKTDKLRLKIFYNKIDLLQTETLSFFTLLPSCCNITPMGFYDLLFFFPQNSILVVGNLYTPSTTAYGIFSKSEVHAGFLAMRAGIREYRKSRGLGNGERWKGYMKRRHNPRKSPQYPITLRWIIDDLLNPPVSRLDLQTKASWLAFKGTPSITIVKGEYSIIYPPLWEPGYKEEPTQEEVEGFLAKYPHAIKLGI